MLVKGTLNNDMNGITKINDYNMQWIWYLLGGACLVGIAAVIF